MQLKKAEITLKNGKKYTGFLIDSELKNVVKIKLKNGYNIGFLKENIRELKTEIIEKEESEIKIKKGSDFKVLLINSGGTIASKLDPTTGAVASTFTLKDFFILFEDLFEYASFEYVEIAKKYSENRKLEDLVEIAKKIVENKDDYDAFFILHGTDTMHYAASAFSFLVESEKPIVFIGAMRSSDRPSSDAFQNLLGALFFSKKTKYGGVFISMHKNLNDDIISINIPTKVRKMHSSRRDAFKPIDVTEFAKVKLVFEKNKVVDGILTEKQLNLPKKGKNIKFRSGRGFSKDVGLIKIWIGMGKEDFEALIKKYKVIILEGTGFGHIPDWLLEVVKKNKEKTFFSTTQAIGGVVNLDVYSTGRYMQKAGIIPLNMLSEVAFVKACWALETSKSKDEFLEIMKKEIYFEFKERCLDA